MKPKKPKPSREAAMKFYKARKIANDSTSEPLSPGKPAKVTSRGKSSMSGAAKKSTIKKAAKMNQAKGAKVRSTAKKKKGY